jgi:ATP-dependent exoDNAse (exonuclease V) beta subunit
VAITFTDKAAGELKLRLRDDIEKAIEKATGEEKGRLQEAADDLERAPVSTIHSFALGLLR